MVKEGIPEFNQKSGQNLKRIGAALFVIGTALLFGSWLSSGLVGVSSRDKKIDLGTAANSTPIAPAITLHDAKKEIPGVLRDIYAALNQGNPQNVAQYIQTEIFRDSQKLDDLCQPFSYRAHYIESIIEKPNKLYLVRVRTLFKPLHVKAYIMHFTNIDGRFLLVQAEGDSFVLEKEVAIHTARQFVFAAKAAEWDVLKRLSSKQLDLSPLENEWGDIFSSLKDPTVDSVNLESEGCFKLKVRVADKGFSYYLDSIYIFVEPDNASKVVEVIHRATMDSRKQRHIEDLNLEQNMLARFKVEREQ
jgi:hypothetical protein